MMYQKNKDRKWHLAKAIGLNHILALLGMISSLLWWAVNVEKRISVLEMRTGTGFVDIIDANELDKELNQRDVRIEKLLKQQYRLALKNIKDQNKSKKSLNWVKA